MMLTTSFFSNANEVVRLYNIVGFQPWGEAMLSLALIPDNLPMTYKQ